MGDHMRARETVYVEIPSLSWTAYDVNFKLMVIRHNKGTVWHPGNIVFLEPMYGDGGNTKNNY